jgi:Ala-tRNA(Pro) deacylase
MQAIAIDPTFYTSAPAGQNRLEKEMRTYDLLDRLSIPYARLDHDVTATVESCLEIERMFEIEICKNLFLCNSQKTNFYLLMMPGNKKLRTSELSRQLITSRLSFAEESYMEEFLDLTPGSVTVLGLMNDKEHRVQLLIDRDLLTQEYIGCHPCINTSSLKIKVVDLLDKFLPSVNHTPIFIELT